MLRWQGRAILALTALSLVVTTSVADAAELPASTNLQLNPNPLRPGDELTISGNTLVTNPVCQSAQIRLTRPEAPEVVYSFGQVFNSAAAFAVRDRQLTRLEVPVEFVAGTYNVGLECTNDGGSRTFYAASQVLTVDPNAPSASTTSTAAATASSASLLTGPADGRGASGPSRHEGGRR